MTQLLPIPQDKQLIELLTLEFADSAYQRSTTPAGQARKSALQNLALSFDDGAVKWAPCVEDACRVLIISCKRRPFIHAHKLYARIFLCCGRHVATNAPLILFP